MRVTSRLLTSSLLVSLASLPLPALADDTAKADPFRPVQPSWPEGWSAPANKPAESPPATEPAAEANEVDGDSEDKPLEQAEAAPALASADTPPEPQLAPVTETAPVPESKALPVADVDLRTPHILMATGGALIGVSAIAAIAIGITTDRPDLAGATFAIGGLLGVGGLTVGVVMQNNRLEAAGHEVPPALPSGMMLKVALVR